MPPQKQANAAVSLIGNYDRLVAAGNVTDDAAQREVLAALEALLPRLGQKPDTGLFARFFGAKAPGPKGLYIWGNVGRGKSMLMDLFIAQVEGVTKRRVHFHAFMQEVHRRIHHLRQQSQYAGDPVAALAKEIAGETQLLCFDELQATDPADATLLFRLFSGLFEGGVMVVGTSNHPPASLYTGGVQKERFGKFITLLEQHMQVIALSSRADYRRKQIRSLEKTYVWPLGAQADAFIEQVVDKASGGQKPRTETLDIQRRKLRFTLYNDAVGRFTFPELCGANLGPADYLALAKRLETLILTDIPLLTPEQRNEAKRFVTLIDALYESKVKLIAAAAAAPDALYPEGDGSFEFKRTASRLVEMQSEKYLNE